MLSLKEEKENIAQAAETGNIKTILQLNAKNIDVTGVVNEYVSIFVNIKTE